MANIVGTDSSETLQGTTSQDTISGKGGNDVIYGNGSAGPSDYLYGGDGNDTIYGGAGSNWIRGDAGDDKFYSSSGDDNLDGGSGFDTFFVAGPNNGYDDYTGGPVGASDIDIISSSLTSDTTIGVKTLSEIDVIQGNTTRRTTIQLPTNGASVDFYNTELRYVNGIEGQSGVDNVIGSRQSDTISLYAGNDFYTDKNAAPSSSVDYVFAGTGNDAAIFGAGKSGNTLTANTNGTWTVRDTTLSVTYTVRHTAQTSWRVDASTGGVANLYEFETLNFGDKQLTSTAPITPQSLSSGPAAMEFATGSSEADSIMSDGAAVSGERDIATAMAVDVDSWISSYDLIASDFYPVASMTYSDANVSSASSSLDGLMLATSTDIIALTVA